MTWKQYGHVALLGAAIAFGDIVASHFNGSQLGALHILVSCVLTALVTAKVIDTSLKARI
jgi:hypothetical protein